MRAARKYLVSIEDDQALVAWDLKLSRVDLRKCVVEVAALAVGLPFGAGPAGHVDVAVPQGLHPLLFLTVLAVVAQVNGLAAAERQGCSGGCLDGQLDALLHIGQLVTSGGCSWLGLWAIVPPLMSEASLIISQYQPIV